MYEKDHKVPKSDIDSFISASDKKFFTKRIIVATNESWSDEVRGDLLSKSIPVTVITGAELKTSNVDWSAYDKGIIANLNKRKVRPYQAEAINQTILGFKIMIEAS